MNPIEYIALEGYNQQGQATDFSKNIKEFELLKEQKAFRPIFVDILPYSLYIKVVLYYKDEAIEDFFLKNIKYEPIEIPQKTDTAEQADLKEKKKSINALYERALRTTKASEKGKLLEHVITDLIKLVPKLMVVGVRVDDGIQEVDIYVRNFNREGVWADFAGMIFVECKNWSDPGQIRLFLAKGYKIVILNGKDIEEILNCKDVSAKIDEKYIKLYT
jgi:hypothetical protein